MFIVQLEFKRIQTFLFASPRLKDMVGANALLGDVIRQRLPELVIKHRSDGVFDRFVNTFFDHSSKPDDPLADKESWFGDSPSDTWRQGVLSRDGGHFYCIFGCKEQALTFLSDACHLIRTELPGVLVDYSVSDEKELDRAEISNTRCTTHIAQGQIEPDSFPILPILQPCEISHDGLAEHIDDSGPENIYLSSASKNKRNFLWSGSTRAIQSADIASQLMDDFSGQNKKRLASDLKQLVGDDYLAILVADGNNMGKRFKEWIEQEKSEKPLNWLEKQAKAEVFFYKARAALRQATVDGIRQQFPYMDREDVLPFQILMLGGDDLLIACRAKDALSLTQAIDQRLAELTGNDDDAMTLGIGVVIASHSLPFYRLHHIAEELASSAKVLTRQKNKCTSSVIDWQVITQSWADDPIRMRVEHDIVHYQLSEENTDIESLILTGKPYQMHKGVSLHQLYQEAQKLYQKLYKNQEGEDNDACIARSQLRYLQSQLSLGLRHSQSCWANLPESLNKALTDSLHTLQKDQVSEIEQQASDNSTETKTLPLWMPTQQTGVYRTLFSDLIELIEINSLKNAGDTMS